MQKLKMIDLCSGTGAFSYVLNKTGKIETVFANDLLDSSEKIFNLNHIQGSIKLIKGDLTTIKEEDIPQFDILTAGFSCQPYSIAGKQKGFEDKRSDILWKILNIIKYHNPSIVILENVKNLKSHNNGKTLKIILDILVKLKYYVKYEILNTCKITNIPQNRERRYIVCFKSKDLYDKFNFDFPEVKNLSISNFLEKIIPEKYYYTENTTKIYDKLKDCITNNISNNTVYQYRRYYVRENKNNICPTLTENMGSGGHNVPLILDDNGIRKFTPRECFNLQGFPQDYILPKLSDSKLYSLAGNAVSIPIIELITNKILGILQ